MAAVSNRLQQFLLLVFMGLMSFSTAIYAGQDLRVLLVLSDANPLYQNFAKSFKQNLPATIQAEVLQRAADYSENNQPVNLIVTVGMKAAEQMAGKTATSMLLAMIPSSEYDDLLTKRPRSAHTSAIYLDQPWARQVALLRTALPKHTKVGILYSANTSSSVEALHKQLLNDGATLIEQPVSGAGAVFDSLDAVLSRSEVLLALPDKTIYNTNNIRNILISSYRHGVPLVGFSQALVNAGALYALFSTPDQLAAQTSAATILFAKSWQLVDAQFPTLYTIAVNQEVARSLGTSIKSPDLLHLQVDQILGAVR